MSLLDTASLLLTPNAYKEGKLYSVIPSDGSGDFTFTRATTATRVNSDGLVELVPYNLFTYSEQFDNAAWIQERITITANITTAPNGSLTADKIVEDNTTNSHRARQNAISEQGVEYTLSFYLKASERTKARISAGGLNAFADFDLSNGTIIGAPNLCTAAIISADNGWYRCSITYTQTSATSSVKLHLVSILNAAGDFSYLGDGVSGIFVWGAQLVEGTNALPYQKTETRLNIPRIDYSLGGCPNILLEPQRTNVVVNSVFSGGGTFPTSWNTVLTGGTSAPTVSIFTKLGQAWTFTTSNNRQIMAQFYLFTAGSTTSFSVFVEAATAGIQVQAVVGQFQSGTETYFKNGVPCANTEVIEAGNRYTSVMVASASGSQQIRLGIGIRGNVTGSVTLSMPQFEAGSYATSYIPTTTASVTRNGEILNKTGISSLIGQTEGVFYAEIVTNDDIISTQPISLNDGTTSNRILLYIDNSKLYTLVTTGGTIQASISSSTILKNTKYKLAVGYKSNDIVFYVNGVLIGTDTSATIPTCSAFSSHNGVATSFYYSKLNSVVIWKERLTNDQLAQLTTI